MIDRKVADATRGEARVVITGQTLDRRCIVAVDEVVAPFDDPAAHGYDNAMLWGCDGTYSLPCDGMRPMLDRLSPSPGDVRFVLLTLYPEESDRHNTPAPRAGINTMPGDPPGMHFTASIDLIVVIEGTVRMELSGGSTVHLATGDCLVQNGTPHSWHNDGPGIARLGVVAIGAEHALVQSPSKRA
jgi:mannose-6-phosphate isomerase-like protein (cupin superfamily)